MKQNTIVALVQDRPGVLSRVAGLVRRRGYNIASLAVGHSEQPGISRMTIVVESGQVEQVVKQLYRLIEVIKVSDVTEDPTVEREMVVLKLHAPPRRAPRDRLDVRRLRVEDRRCRRQHHDRRDDRHALKGRELH